MCEIFGLRKDDRPMALVTTKEIEYGILVQADGSSYARYSAFIRKSEIGGLNYGKTTNA